MGPSEAEIETRLAVLRRRREALDREIADLVLYLELGRRLAAAGTASDADDAGARAESGPRSTPVPRLRERDAPPSGSAAPARPRAERGPDRSEEPEVREVREVREESGASGAPGAIPPAVPFAEDAVGARRYGRALVEAARAAIAEAGRPLHAAEILAVLVGRVFTVPGRDPVAALNTRLWKRAGPDGPLRRVGEATYALAAPT